MALHRFSGMGATQFFAWVVSLALARQESMAWRVSIGMLSLRNTAAVLQNEDVADHTPFSSASSRRRRPRRRNTFLHFATRNRVWVSVAPEEKRREHSLCHAGVGSLRLHEVPFPN